MILLYIQIFNKYLPHFLTVFLLKASIVNRNLMLKINAYPFRDSEFFKQN